MEIPNGYKGKVYFYKNLSHSFITTSTHLFKSDSEYLLLASVDVDVEFNADIVESQLMDILQQERENVINDADKKIDIIDQQIKELER